MPTAAIGGHMKAFAGLGAVAVILAASALLTKPPGATPRVATVEVVESQFDEVPPYIDFDPNDWR
jgi:hypothetical protein